MIEAIQAAAHDHAAKSGRPGEFTYEWSYRLYVDAVTHFLNYAARAATEVRELPERPHGSFADTFRTAAIGPDSPAEPTAGAGQP